jgi:putative DNA primase/helicase
LLNLNHLSQGEAAKQLAETYGLNDKPYTVRSGAESKAMWEPLTPIPANAPSPPQAHFKHGKSSHSWAYHNGQGAVLCYVLRFDLKGKDGKPVLDKYGKQEKAFAPLTFCLNAATGQTAWRWLALPEPRPLYNLDQLTANPQATVIVCEGEKSTDAASRLFPLPEYVTTTSPNGAQSPGKADWSHLAGRTVWLMPDNGKPGQSYVEKVAKAV